MNATNDKLRSVELKRAFKLWPGNKKCNDPRQPSNCPMSLGTIDWRGSHA